MSEQKITLELRGKQVYYNGSYLFTPPVIQVDQERQDGESWLAMRLRIEPELEKAQKRRSHDRSPHSQMRELSR